MSIVNPQLPLDERVITFILDRVIELDRLIGNTETELRMWAEYQRTYPGTWWGGDSNIARNLQNRDRRLIGTLKAALDEKHELKELFKHILPDVGDRVHTVDVPDPPVWASGYRRPARFGVDGTVSNLHANGRMVLVTHEDGTTGFYAPRELTPALIGARVRTVEVPDPATDWSQLAQDNRKFGVEGVVIDSHNSHGLCYDVRHDDGTVGCYEYRELVRVW